MGTLWTKYKGRMGFWQKIADATKDLILKWIYAHPEVISSPIRDDPQSDGYYLVEFIGLPYTDQETGEFLVDCNWLYKIKGCSFWYESSENSTTVRVLNIVSTDVDLIPMGLNNAPKTNRKYCRKVG